jgi:SAM-dependent methyltransferase
MGASVRILSDDNTAKKNMLRRIEECKRSIAVASDKVTNPNSKRYLQGIVDILNCKTMIDENIDDIFWFYENGMHNCETVVDFGCGSGYISYLVSYLVDNVTGFEYSGSWVNQQYSAKDYMFAFSAAHLALERQNLKFRYYNSFPLQIDNHTIDGVILYAVIEHIHPTMHSALFRELRRILREDGLLFIGKLPRVYSYQEHLAGLLGMQGHDQLYRRQEIVNLLDHNGFMVTKIERTGMFLNRPNQISNAFFPIARISERFVKAFLPFLTVVAHDYRMIAGRK